MIIDSVLCQTNNSPVGIHQAVECKKCGFSNPQGARFCGGCGNSIASLDCQNCGSSNQPGSRFCSACGKSLVIESKPEQKLEESQAERRLLTVMFCDLVDSTTIVDSLDPEETRSIIRGFQAHARAIIEQFGGRITEYLGDGIVAQFTRHETNAERAINAGLGLIRKLEDENIIISSTGKAVQVRCGIATGLAVVGDMLGDARIRSESAIGLPLNLAARIQGLANPSEIVIAGDTFRLTRGLFEFEDIGEHALKGIKDPQRVWRVIKEKNVSSRFMAHSAEMTPMVDREDAMGVLLNCWESSKRGQADAVIFTGEAGIGKSRILQELGKRISKDNFFYLEYQCAPYHTNTALYPLTSRLEVAAGYERNDNNEQKLEKLEKLVAMSSEDMVFDMPAFVSLMGLRADPKWPMPNLDPDEKKERIFTALINNMFALAKTKPLLIKIEDVHWIDPTTLELMGRMIKSLKGHNILLLITSRPGFDADFLEETHVTRLEIDRLPQQYTAQLIQGVQGTENLPQEVIHEILQRTEGIPLFAEELSKSLMETLQFDGSSDNSLVKKDIPTTLHDSLLSRLDRLPKTSRTIAQLAAVIGRDFSFDLLEHIADYQDKNLFKDLTPLLEAQLVYQDKAPPYAEFCFKHALVRDVAYENLLQSERVDIHKRIAEAIEDNYPQIIKNTPELVARHFTEGKQYEKAVKYWLEAGKKASQQFALLEAREHLTSGINVLGQLPENNENKLIKLEILITLGPVLMALEGSGSEITRKNYKDAVNLCDQLPESGMQFTALWGQWQVSLDYQGDHGLVWANRLEQLANKLEDNDLKLQAHHCQWTTFFHHGEFGKAHKHIIDGLGFYCTDKHKFHSRLYGGHDPRVCGHGFLSHVLWFLGRYNESLHHGKLCFQYANDIKHTGSYLHAIELNLLLAQFGNDAIQTEYWTEELKKICERIGLPEYEGKLLCCKGIVSINSGELERGIDFIEKGLIELEKIGTTEDVPFFTENLARACGETHSASRGLKYIDEIIDSLESYSLRYWQAEIYRRKAELLAKLRKVDEALTYFNKSLNLATEQGALSLQLRTAISYYNFNSENSLYPKSRDLLENIYSKFSENEESPDLRQATDFLEYEN